MVGVSASLLGDRHDMLLVEIEKPASVSLSQWFSELREWLDENYCTSSAFTQNGRRLDGLIYRISFDNTALAHRFSLRFKRYSPVVRRATAFERDQLRAMASGREAPVDPKSLLALRKTTRRSTG